MEDTEKKQMEIMKLKNTITKIIKYITITKNLVGGLNSRMNITEERTSELETGSRKKGITQSKQQGNKKEKCFIPCGTVQKKSNIRIITVVSKEVRVLLKNNSRKRLETSQIWFKKVRKLQIG